MSVWRAGSCPRQPLLVVAGRGLRTAVGVLRSPPPATEFIWPLPLHFIHHHILQDIRMCGFYPSEIPKALSRDGPWLRLVFSLRAQDTSRKNGHHSVNCEAPGLLDVSRGVDVNLGPKLPERQWVE